MEPFIKYQVKKNKRFEHSLAVVSHNLSPKNELMLIHMSAVIQRKNVVQLNVDTVDNYKVGPPVSTNNSPKGSLYVGGIPGE